MATTTRLEIVLLNSFAGVGSGVRTVCKIAAMVVTVVAIVLLGNASPVVSFGKYCLSLLVIECDALSCRNWLLGLVLHNLHVSL